MRKFLTAASAMLFVFSAAIFGVGEVLSAPAKSVIGPPPAELSATTVTILDSHKRAIAGWFSPAASGKGSVLLLHGVRSNRRQMIGRAIFLHDLGYSVLLIDLQAHGESEGSRISFGYREGDGVRAAIGFLRASNKTEPVGVIGVSMGAAAFVLSGTTPPPNAVILESMYPTVTQAVKDRLRLRLGAIGPLFAPLLLHQLGFWLGIQPSQLRPIDHIADIGSPVLIISGTRDQHTSVAETRRLYTAAAAPKALWLVDGAAHVDLHAYAPDAYDKKITDFLSRYMVKIPDTH